MFCLRRRIAGLFLGAVVAGAIWPAVASEASFPFGTTLVLDAAPQRGSKRMPMIEIEDNGAVAIYLWCASVRGDASVADDSITIVPKQAMPSQCPADSVSRDAELLLALSQVTTWRRHGDVVEFAGSTTSLRFRLMTN